MLYDWKYEMNNIFKDKLKAFSIHLSISLIFVLICASMVFFIWYPNPLVAATGVGTLFLMMLGIDLILGPTLTFMIYKKFKKTLKMDLFIIATIQLSAMAYGIYAMYQGRPVWIAFTVDRFELVRANELLEDNKDFLPSFFFPQYVYVNIKPINAKDQLDRLLFEARSNISPAQQPKYYRSFTMAAPEMQRKSRDIKELQQYNNEADLAKIIKQYPQATAWLPLQANFLDMVVLIDKQNGEVIKIVNLRPWN